MMKKLLAATLVSSSLLAGTAATAASMVTLNPQADNGLGANGVISAANGPFQTVGASADLLATLTIAGSSGVQAFTETGTIELTSFKDAANNVVAGSGVNSNYDIFASFTLSGFGQWVAPNFFSAAPGSISFNVNLYAVSATAQTIQLGTATLINTPTNFGFAILSGAAAPNTNGTATTTLGALLDFIPAPGTTGVNGFFQAPTPFIIDIGVGNAGGNPLNTTYSVDGAGVVTVVTGVPGTNSGTANITFVTGVPEPAALSLVGIALVGAAFASRRRAKAAA
jgi:hypothetical protein